MHENLQTALTAAKKSARRFASQTHGDPEEASAEAMLPMLRASTTYTGEVPFEKHISRHVRSHLIGRWRKEVAAKRGGTFARREGDLKDLPARVPFDAEAFLAGLTDDGRVLALLAIDPPDWVERRLCRAGCGGRWLYGRLARLIKQYALGVLGWERRRFSTAWREVRESL